MLLLALDTAMAACSVAVLRQGEAVPLAQAYVPMEKGHAEALPPMVQNVMAQAAITFAQLSRIAVTTGPGTFTGVRIGLAFARGLGLALNIPVIGIDTLSAIAANEKNPVPRLVVADARKDEVYTALLGPDGELVRPPAVMTLPHAHAMEGITPGTALLGSAADAAHAQAPHIQRSRAGDLPVAARFGHIAFTSTPGPMPAPLYLRAADAKPQPGYLLRPAQLTLNRIDASAASLFALMHGECFDNGWDATAFASLIAAPGAVAIIAQHGEEPAAFLLARQAADEAEIITIGTRPFAQRQGLATRTIEYLFASLKETGVTQVFLEVAAANTAARALYTALGFHDAGTRKGYYARDNGQRDDAIVMRRTLAP